MTSALPLPAANGDAGAAAGSAAFPAAVAFAAFGAFAAASAVRDFGCGVAQLPIVSISNSPPEPVMASLSFSTCLRGGLPKRPARWVTSCPAGRGMWSTCCGAAIA